MSKPDDQSDFLKANAAAMRALAGGVERQVRYAGQDTHIGKTEIRLPSLPREHSRAARSDSRGAADSAGLWLAHHDEKRPIANSAQPPLRQNLFSKLQNRPV